MLFDRLNYILHLLCPFVEGMGMVVLSVLAENGLSHLFILINMYNVQVFEKLYSITKSEH